MAEESTRWSLEAARAIFGEIRALTAQAVREVDALAARSERSEDLNTEDIDRRLQDTLDRWVRAIDALGVEVKGPWLVDFDNGRGYYCWKSPEEGLDHFHGYDEGFEGRIRIQ